MGGSPRSVFSTEQHSTPEPPSSTTQGSLASVIIRQLSFTTRPNRRQRWHEPGSGTAGPEQQQHTCVPDEAAAAVAAVVVEHRTTGRRWRGGAQKQQQQQQEDWVWWEWRPHHRSFMAAFVQVWRASRGCGTRPMHMSMYIVAAARRAATKPSHPLYQAADRCTHCLSAHTATLQHGATASLCCANRWWVPPFSWPPACVASLVCCPPTMRQETGCTGMLSSGERRRHFKLFLVTHTTWQSWQTAYCKQSSYPHRHDTPCHMLLCCWWFCCCCLFLFRSPFLLGSCLFISSALLSLRDCQDCWWSPKPRLRLWWMHLSNTVGSIGFWLCSFFGLFAHPAEKFQRWGMAFSCLWGSCCFAIAAYLQLLQVCCWSARAVDLAA